MTRCGIAGVLLSVAAFLTVTGLPASAQIAGPPDGSNSFRDTSVLKPLAGQKVAIIVFEDMECPACAAAHPVELQAASQYHVPVDRYDFPLQMHMWSRDAAVFARYLQDKVNPDASGPVPDGPVPAADFDWQQGRPAELYAALDAAARAEHAVCGGPDGCAGGKGAGGLQAGRAVERDADADDCCGDADEVPGDQRERQWGE